MHGTKTGVLTLTPPSGTMLTGHEHSRSSDQKWNGLNEKGKSYNKRAAKAAFFSPMKPN
ncbi:hypothetical protein SMATCC274_04590 [Serratia marcescens]|nr:hypothetical protein SMATCC274_04590 [Serratia marcescens]